VMLHLTPRDEGAQLAAVDALRAVVAALPPGRPLIVLGDLNAAPDSATVRRLTAPPDPAISGGRLRDAWPLANPDDPGATMPSHAPVSRIEYILIGDGPTFASAARIGATPDADGFYASDHLGVAATLRLGAGR
jgi:endonuclease/exonuclease/phosphatase family metal-dependent hydrolase